MRLQQYGCTNDQIDDRKNTERQKQMLEGELRDKLDPARVVPIDITVRFITQISPPTPGPQYPKVDRVPAVLYDKVSVVDEFINDLIRHHRKGSAGNEQRHRTPKRGVDRPECLVVGSGRRRSCP